MRQIIRSGAPWPTMPTDRQACRSAGSRAEPESRSVTSAVPSRSSASPEVGQAEFARSIAQAVRRERGSDRPDLADDQQGNGLVRHPAPTVGGVQDGSHA
jgi:hypothetical protein